MSRSEIPTKFERWAEYWDYWHLNLEEKKMKALDECLHFGLSNAQLTKIVVGVETLDQFEEIIASSKSAQNDFNWVSMACNDKQLINPSNWNGL